MKYLPTNSLMLFVVFLANNFVFSQTTSDDSLKIEQLFLGAIGRSNVIDSLQKAVLIDAHKHKSAYVIEDTYWYNLSKSRFLSGQLDEAFIAANKGIELSKQHKKPYRTAKFHNLKASVYAYQKNNEKAIESFNTAFSLCENQKDDHTAALIRNNIANIFFGLSDFESAYKYSAASYHQLVKENDTTNLPGITGIYAVTSLKLGKLKEGKRLSKKALYLAQKYNSPIGLIIGYHSMGEVHLEEKKYEEAILSFNESLKLSEMYQQAYYVMLNKLGLQYATLMAKKYSESIQYGQEALEETNKMSNENTLYAIHKNLGYAFAGLGKNEDAFQNLSLAHDYYIESAGTENQKAINDILIKYDTEKKEKEIIKNRLTISENQNKLIRRAQWITVLGTVLALVLFSYFFYNRSQKQKAIQLKKEQETKRILAAVSAEEKERERISNELHDGMASVITGIKLKLESFSQEENGSHLIPVVDQLKSLHDETRRMSHNLMPLGLNQENWVERMEQYCRENSIQTFKINFNNHLKIVPKLDPSLSIILYRSLQELIHNAQKHAESDVCHVQLSKATHGITLTVEDEGKGFSISQGDSQGLNSLRKRLAEIGGELEMDSKIGEGALMTIHLNEES